MERAVQPELAKRIVRTNEQGHSQLGQMSAMTLVQGTRAGGGKDTPVADRHKDVTILDIYQNAASAKIYASGWVDYLHLAKWNGRWVIVNVLWELHPAPRRAQDDSAGNLRNDIGYHHRHARLHGLPRAVPGEVPEGLAPRPGRGVADPGGELQSCAGPVSSRAVLYRRSLVCN